MAYLAQYYERSPTGFQVKYKLFNESVNAIDFLSSYIANRANISSHIVRKQIKEQEARNLMIYGCADNCTLTKIDFED